MGDRFGRDVAAGAHAVLDNEWLPEPLRQPPAHQPREDVSWAAGGKTDDNPHSSRRINVGTGSGWKRRQHGNARCQI
jgi:hypothetical protein